VHNVGGAIKLFQSGRPLGELCNVWPQSTVYPLLKSAGAILRADKSESQGAVGHPELMGYGIKTLSPHKEAVLRQVQYPEFT